MHWNDLERVGRSAPGAIVTAQIVPKRVSHVRRVGSLLSQSGAQVRRYCGFHPGRARRGQAATRAARLRAPAHLAKSQTAPSPAKAREPGQRATVLSRNFGLVAEPGSSGRRNLHPTPLDKRVRPASLDGDALDRQWRKVAE